MIVHMMHASVVVLHVHGHVIWALVGALLAVRMYTPMACQHRRGQRIADSRFTIVLCICWTFGIVRHSGCRGTRVLRSQRGQTTAARCRAKGDLAVRGGYLARFHCIGIHGFCRR